MIRGLLTGVLIVAVAMGGPLPSTTAAFTDDGTSTGNSVATATLIAPDLEPSATTSGSVTLAWEPTASAGAPAEYTVTRSSAADPAPITIYQGADPGYEDPGNIPLQLLSEAVVAVRSGKTFTLALTDQGRVWAWGDNARGQLGDGTTTSSATPVQVGGALNGRRITSIAAGADFALALAADGTVWAWGEGSSGQLGDGQNTRSPAPIAVALPARTFTAIATGGGHSLALDDTGTVWSWGDNVVGQLGRGGAAWQESVPGAIAASGFGQRVTEISAGLVHSLALTEGGAVFAWGSGSSGQLGTPRSMALRPNQVPSTFGGHGIAHLGAGDEASFAIDSDGTVWSWGSNHSGALGTGSSDDRSLTPTAVTGALTGRAIVAIDGGYRHAVALAADGSVWTWGYNAAGQLGDETRSDSRVPVQVRGILLDHPMGSVSAGSSTTVAAGTGLPAQAWGDNPAGQFGDGSTGGSSSLPVSSEPLESLGCAGGATQIAGTALCTLAPESDYDYTLTVRIGGWTAQSTVLHMTTAAR